MPRAPSRLDPDNAVHSFAREMRRLRLYAGDPSLGELARAMSCSHSTVSAYLNGRRLPAPKRLESFVMACNGNVVEWLNRLEATREQRDRLQITAASKPAVADPRGQESARHRARSAPTELGQIHHPVEILRRKLTDVERQADRRGWGSARSRTSGERITVALIPAVQADLRRLQERTKLSKTDIANRAITSYEFFDAQLRAGHDLIIRDNTTGENRFIRLL
jgi:transcriptional regulator with XRE-family HTH domain